MSTPVKLIDELASACKDPGARQRTRAVYAAILTKQQIDARRARGKAASFSPWQTDYAMMARKTALRALLTAQRRTA